MSARFVIELDFERGLLIELLHRGAAFEADADVHRLGGAVWRADGDSAGHIVGWVVIWLANAGWVNRDGITRDCFCVEYVGFGHRQGGRCRLGRARHYCRNR